MTVQTRVILNPYANRWGASKLEGAIRSALTEAGIRYTLELSQGPGHCQDLAAQAARDGYGRVVAAGGDGTLGEVVNGLLAADAGSRTPTLGIIPVGTANDFVANLKLDPSLPAAVARLVSGRPRQIDVCRLNDRYFINNAGLGLEPHITALQQRMRGVSGIVRYLLATLVGIAQNPQWQMTLTWDGGEYAGPATLVSIGNGARTGGLFFTVPDARPADGLLSFTCGNIPTRWQILRAFPMILKSGPGNIAEHPQVIQRHCHQLTVRTNRPTHAHTDGELLPGLLDRAQFEILPGRLEVLVDGSLATQTHAD